MFRKFVLTVMRSYEGRRLVEQAVRAVLEDKNSSTRKGMMRIIRAEARDAVQDSRERERDLAELDAGYQEWAQQRREALLEEEARKKQAAAAEARLAAQLLAEQPRVAEHPFARFPLDQPVRVVQDALFQDRIGRVVGQRESHGFAEIIVKLEGHTMWISFTPNALEPLTATEQPPVEPQDRVPTQLLPVFDEKRIAELRAAGLSEESAVAMSFEDEQ